MQQAARRLAQRDSVKCVANWFGCSDPFYFSTVFKRTTGHSPSQMHEKAGLR
jgi:AraC-like DNA-binding protein